MDYKGNIKLPSGCASASSISICMTLLTFANLTPVTTRLAETSVVTGRRDMYLK